MNGSSEWNKNEHWETFGTSMVMCRCRFEGTYGGYPMKKSLLATVAAAALIAGPAFAQKQEAPAGDVKGAAPPPAAIQKAPAEKIAPSTTGQASPSGKASGEIKADTKSGADSNKTRMNADTKSGVKADSKASGTTGQAAPSGTTSSESKAGSDTKAGGSVDTKSGAKASGTTDTKASGTAAQGQAAAGANVALTSEQKSTIRSSVLTANAPRVANVNFSIRVGTVVPRTVRLVAVPAPLIAIHPAWRGYMYFVHDDRIIIVEPGTLRIVTVLVV
jgi:hypothetical protein